MEYFESEFLDSRIENHSKRINVPAILTVIGPDGIYHCFGNMTISLKGYIFSKDNYQSAYSNSFEILYFWSAKSIEIIKIRALCFLLL